MLISLLLMPLQAFCQALVIEDLACRGNQATSCNFILGHLYLSSGDAVDEKEIGNARLRLSSLPAFTSVDIYLEKGSSRNRVRLVVEVIEADPYVREWLIGTSWRVDSLSQLVGGRLTHQNLFGTGKMLDLTMVALAPFDGRIRSEYAVRLQYVDPQWFDSKRMFLIAGVSGGRNDFETLDDDRFQVDNVGLDLTVGRRLWAFSYLSLFYRYNPVANVEYQVKHPDGGIERGDFSLDGHVLIASYGWNSEDDPYFPTRGSRAVLRGTWTEDTKVDWNGGLRKTWTTRGGTSWNLRLLETPGTEYRGTLEESLPYTVGVARPIDFGGEVRRGRWYFEAGLARGHNPEGEQITEYGAKLGLRLQTRSFGVVDLYVIGTGLHTRRDDP